jgi:hypothetical protein
MMRTPLASVLKSVARVGARQEVAHRRTLAADLSPAVEVTEAAAIFARDGHVDVTALIDANRLEKLGAAADALSAKAQAAQASKLSKKTIWSSLLEEDFLAGRLSSDGPFVAFALQPAIVDILAAIYGEIPRLDSVLLTRSIYDGTPPSYSQLWHRDYDDTKVVKLFVYLSDVIDQRDGPFTFVPGPASDRARYSRRSHRSDASLATKISLDEARSITSPRLTAFLVETSRCLHMGSRLGEGHERLMYTATFFSTPRLYPEPPLRIALTGRENAIERSLLGVS